MATTALGVANPALAGYASMVVDLGTGEVLNEVNADAVNHPASLTKMMTLYLAFEALQKGQLRWDQQLPVSSWAAEKAPTKLGLQPGETIAVRDCVLGMITKSANDAATVLAEALGGSESAFARVMTGKARELGMTGTVFRNASGLPDEEQVTTARDLVKLSIALYQNFPQQYHYFATKEFVFRGQVVTGHNHLMDRYLGMDGLKTGFTSASGFNLAASAERDHHRLFAVVMGGRSAPARDRLMATLLDNGFAHRPTDPILVAQAAGQSPRTARRLFARAESMVAMLSPISKAEAAPLQPAVALRGRHGHVVTATVAERWSVQVGAYSRRGQAAEAAHRAERVAELHGKEAFVMPPSRREHVYRARLTGFSSEKQAQDACRALHRHGSICVVVPPSKDSLRLAGS